MTADFIARVIIMSAALLFPLAWPASAQGPRVDGVAVLEAGFYESKLTGETQASPDAPGGVAKMSGPWTFLAKPPAATARVGTSFGMRVRVEGRPADADVVLTWRWKIPGPGARDAKTGKLLREVTEDVPTRIGAVSRRGWGFDEEGEIVRGKWTLQVYLGIRKLAQRSFVIK